MKVALVYDRLNKLGGAEQVLLAFHKLFPQADWYTSVWDPARTPFTRNWRVHSSWLSHVPLLRTHHEWFPFLMPFIFEAYDFSSYDLVISIGSAECKGIITDPSTFHLHYCLTPTRYLYSHASEYLTNPLYRFVGRYLRAWDQVAATRPDLMLAISTQVKKRIKKYYNRDADILLPPVDDQKFASINSSLTSSILHLPSSYFLVVSRLVPYKRIDTLVRVFNQLPKDNLVIVGIGSELRKLRTLAHSNIHFAGLVDDQTLVRYYQHCQAYLQANEEDFGLSMVEAGLAGRPVIAYGVGGACDIVVPGVTGLLIPGNDVQSFISAVDKFRSLSFDSGACRKNALSFAREIWQAKLKRVLKPYVQATTI